MEIFLEGKKRPDVFFTEAAFCYLQQKNPETALNAVIKQMRTVIEKGYEPEIVAIIRQCRFKEIFNKAFGRQCQTLLKPAWKRAHGD